MACTPTQRGLIKEEGKLEETLTFELAFAIVGAVGIIAAILSRRNERDTETIDRLVRLETKVDMLCEDVQKHNNLVERTYKVESDLNTAFKHIDQQRGRIERLEDAKIGGTE